jgi:hypothetical protein
MLHGRSAWAAAVGIVALVACGQPATEQQKPPNSAPPASDTGQPVIRVTGHGTDPGNASICESFRLTDAQAKEFFAKATAITAEQVHDNYDVLPCWVEGTTTKGADKQTWKIRAGGTAEVTAANGDVTYLGCKTCDDLLQ